MGYSNGVYTRTHNFSADASAGINILAARMDAELDDMASAMTNVVWTRDGNTTPSTNVPMGGRRFVNVAAATSVSNYMRVKEFIENVPIFMQDADSSADRISVSSQYFTSVSANQAPVDGTKIMVRVASNKSSAVLYLDGHSANVEYQDGNRIAAAMVSGGIYELTYSSADTAWKLPTPDDGRTAAEIAAGVTPVSYQYKPGNILRYGTNTTPGTTDMGAALRAALSVAAIETTTIDRPEVYIPSGTYLINSTAGSDTFGNGGLVPLQSGSSNPNPDVGVRIYGDGSSTRLLCGSNNMIMLRVSRSFVDVENLQIDGNGHTGVTGIGVVPESMTQLTTLTNQQHVVIRRVALQNLTNGIKFQPGPDVSGSESGCFNNAVEEIFTNFCNRAIWFAAPATVGSSNRPTRSRIVGGTYLRGNVAIHIEKGTEIDLFGVSIELISTTYDVNCPEGTGVPLATPTAIRVDNTNSQNIRLFGGYAEGITKAIVVDSSAAPYMSNFGFGHNASPDSSEAGINQFTPGTAVIARAYDGAGSSNGARLSFGTNNDNTWLFDPDGDGSKTLSLLLNSAEFLRMFNGSFRFSQTPQTLTGAGAVNLTTHITWIVSTGVNALTLANGAEGQVKYLLMKTDGGDATLTPDNLYNGTTITFNDVGDSAHLLFTDGQWTFMGGTATLA